MTVTITRIKGGDKYENIYILDSNMRSDCSYTGILDSPIRVGNHVYLDVDGTLFCTGRVISKNKGIFRTLKGFYEIRY
jgi:hypothetical protein